MTYTEQKEIDALDAKADQKIEDEAIRQALSLKIDIKKNIDLLFSKSKWYGYLRAKRELKDVVRKRLDSVTKEKFYGRDFSKEDLIDLLTSFAYEIKKANYTDASFEATVERKVNEFLLSEKDPFEELCRPQKQESEADDSCKGCEDSQSKE